MNQRGSLKGNLKTCIHIELNEYENMKCQNLWDSATSVLRGKFIA